MFIKNDDLYFHTGHLHFNGIKFKVCDLFGKQSIKLQLCFDNKISSYVIHANVVRYGDPGNIELPDKISEQRNKTPLLLILRKNFARIYETLLSLKQYNDFIKFDNIIHLYVYTDNNCELNNLIILSNNNNTSLCIYDSTNYINNDNTIIVIKDYCQNDNKQISIKNNIVRTASETIIYPGNYDFQINTTMKFSLSFGIGYEPGLITRWTRTYFVSYYIPLSLLVNFINSAQYIDKSDNFIVNNTYDIMKYL